MRTVVQPKAHLMLRRPRSGSARRAARGQAVSKHPRACHEPPADPPPGCSTRQAGATARASSGDWFYVDDWSETAEVCSIEGKQAAQPMLDHCRDDIGVVDLTTAAAMGNQEVKEAVEHSRPILGNLECGAKGLHICDRGRHGQGWRACLGSRHDNEIFSEHLGLTHRVDPSPSNPAREPSMRRHAVGPMAGWQTLGHSCPRRPGHRPLLRYISWRLSETLPSHGVSWDGKSATRGRFSTRCGPTTVIVTSCSPGGTAAGAVPEMRWSEPTRIWVRMSVMPPPERLTSTTLSTAMAMVSIFSIELYTGTAWR
jgi:hypothetical protein